MGLYEVRDIKGEVLVRETCPQDGVCVGDRITAIINGRIFTGAVLRVVECRYQGGGYYTEYRCDRFACHDREIVSVEKAAA